MGGASTGKPSKWCLNDSCRAALAVNRAWNVSSSSRGGQVAVDQQKAGLHEARLRASCSIGNAAIAEDARLAVDVRMRAGADPRVDEAGVERDQAGPGRGATRCRGPAPPPCSRSPAVRSSDRRTSIFAVRAMVTGSRESRWIEAIADVRAAIILPSSTEKPRGIRGSAKAEARGDRAVVSHTGISIGVRTRPVSLGKMRRPASQGPLKKIPSRNRDDEALVAGSIWT